MLDGVKPDDKPVEVVKSDDKPVEVVKSDDKPVEVVKPDAPADPKVCRFCGRTCLKGSARKQHEKYCEKNPDAIKSKVKAGRPKKKDVADSTPGVELSADVPDFDFTPEKDIKKEDKAVKPITKFVKSAKLVALGKKAVESSRKIIYPDCSPPDPDALDIFVDTGLDFLIEMFGTNEKYMKAVACITAGAVVFAEPGAHLLERRKITQQQQRQERLPEKEPERETPDASEGQQEKKGEGGWKLKKGWKND